jgi:hypothetical protein
MWVAGQVYHPVFSVPCAARALCLREGSLYVRQVIWMDEAHPILHRPGRHVVSVNLCSACITLEETCTEVQAKCSKLGAAECELKALVAHLECGFVLPPFGEQRGEN